MGKTSDFCVLTLKSILNNKNSQNFLSWNPNTFFHKCSKAGLAKKSIRCEGELPLMRLYLLYQRPNSWHLEVETLA